MSVKSPVKRTYSKYTMQESSNLLRMPEHLTDSNILCSRKTYGKKKDYRNISISNENGGSFSATVSEQLKNNGTFESVTSSCNENSNIQKGKHVNSKFFLFNEDDTDYYFSVSTDSPRDNDSSLSIPEASSSGSNYQRTRKNLKNRLSNQRNSSEDLSELTSPEENSNSVSDTKFSNNFFNFKQASSAVSVGNLVEHAKNSVKVIDACVNKQPQNSIIFQTTNHAAKIPGKGAMFPNSSNPLSLLDLVNRFSSKKNQAAIKNNPNNKRKSLPEESGLVPAKKKSVANHTVSSKVNSVEKKVSNSVVSIKNYNKSTILNSDVISTVSYQNALKKSVVKTPSKVPKHLHSPKKGNNVYVDTMKESVATVSSDNCPGVLKKGKVKTPSKGIQKGNNKTVDGVEKSKQRLKNFVSKNKTVKNLATTKGKSTPSHNLATSDLHLIKNKIAEKKSANGDKQIEKPFVHEAAEKMQLDNGEKQIQKSFLMHKTAEKIQSDNGEKQIQKSFLVHKTAEKIQLDNGDKQIEKYSALVMPLMGNVPEGVDLPSCMWSNVSTTDNLTQSDNSNVSFGNFIDLSIPGPSTLNNNDSSLKASDYYVKNVHAEETTTTTTTTMLNQTNIGYDKKRFFRPRTHINDGIEFHQFMGNSFKKIENSCSLKLKEESSKFFEMNPSLLNITVKEFLNTPALTDVLLDYVNGLGMGKSLAIPSTNKGYDFPENFENENLLRVVKDFVHTAISYMVPETSSKPIYISYSHIIQTAMHKMSNRELIVIMQVFKKTNKLFKLKDLCARLSLVALFVIFDEYKNKNRKSR